MIEVIDTHRSHTYDTEEFPLTGNTYKITEFINYLSTHIVYMLKCPCGFIYGGQTKRNLEVRISEHKAAVRCENMDHCEPLQGGNPVLLLHLNSFRY